MTTLSKMVVTGTARNCATTLAADLASLARALKEFPNLHWFIVESDSEDDTVQVLQDFKQKVPNFGFVSLGKLADSLPLRTERLAQCRNRCLDELQNNLALIDATYMVLADLDGTQSLLTQEGLMSCFDNDDWAVCTGNQKGSYYDIWALRHPVWSPNDCWEQKMFFEAAGLGSEKAAYLAVFSRMIEISPDAEWIEVDSAFGGLGIYKTEYLQNARYNGRADNNLWGGQVCEHVAFNKQIKANGGKLFINPAMVNTALNEHSIQAILPEDMTFPITLNVIESNKAASKEFWQLSVTSMTAEDIIGAYKVFLNRHPESMNVIQPRVGMTADMVLVDFLTSSEFLSRKGVDKLVANMLKKMPVSALPLDFLNAKEVIQKKDMDQVLLKMLANYFEWVKKPQD